MPGTEPLPLTKLSREGGKVGVAQPFRRYVVTGDREVTSILTVHNDGKWELSKGTLYDVTHLPCRSALYTPSRRTACVRPQVRRRRLPRDARRADAVRPGLFEQDYAVLFVIGASINIVETTLNKRERRESRGTGSRHTQRASRRLFQHSV